MEDETLNDVVADVLAVPDWVSVLVATEDRLNVTVTVYEDVGEAVDDVDADDESVPDVVRLPETLADGVPVVLPVPDELEDGDGNLVHESVTVTVMVVECEFVDDTVALRVVDGVELGDEDVDCEDEAFAEADEDTVADVDVVLLDVTDVDVVLLDLTDNDSVAEVELDTVTLTLRL